MFGLGITEITLIVVAIAVIYFLYWKTRNKNNKVD